MVKPVTRHKWEVRVPVASRITTPDLHEELVKLANEAEELFGYTKLSRHLQLPAELGKTLQRLDIPVFDRDEVEEYQVAMSSQLMGSTWFRLHISKYSKLIPEHALAKAVELKRALPAVEIFIEFLEERVILPAALDPFIVAKLREEEYYFDMWDEPKFTGGLRSIPRSA